MKKDQDTDKRRKWTDEDYRLLWEDGMTIDEFANATGLTRPGARAAAKRLGLELRPNRSDPFQKYHDAFREGMTASDLARAVGVTPQMAGKAAAKLGLPVARARGRIEENRKYYEVFREGMTAKEFAEAAGIKLRTAYAVGHRLGYRFKRPPTGRQVDDEIRQKYLDAAEPGITIPELARRLGVSRQAAWRMAKILDLDVKIRPRSKKKPAQGEGFPDLI